METEYEAKFYPIDKEKIRKKLKKIGAKLIYPERKMRRAIADKRVNPQIKCDYIRVRDEGNLIRLSAKIHAEEEGLVGDQKEIDNEVASFEKVVQILENSGLKFNRYQETLRETWEFEGADITLDTWLGLPTYAEIEAKSERKVRQIAEKLGFSWEKKIITAVVEIFQKVYNLTLEDALEKISHLTFEKNLFKGLKKAPIE